MANTASWRDSSVPTIVAWLTRTPTSSSRLVAHTEHALKHLDLDEEDDLIVVAGCAANADVVGPEAVVRTLPSKKITSSSIARRTSGLPDSDTGSPEASVTRQPASRPPAPLKAQRPASAGALAGGSSCPVKPGQPETRMTITVHGKSRFMPYISAFQPGCIALSRSAQAHRNPNARLAPSD